MDAANQEKRLAMIAIIVENFDSVEKLNKLMHENGQYVIGRMGLPCRERGVSLISIALDAPSDVISSLSGKLGMLPGVSSKTVYAKTPTAQI
ncbi:MAG: iron-only hydrogenase system regulator [Oscillospiraceae bacterium]